MQGQSKRCNQTNYLYELHLIDEHIHSREDKTGFEIPFHNRLLLEIATQLSSLFKVETLEICTQFEGKPHLLQTFIWLHLQDLF